MIRGRHDCLRQPAGAQWSSSCRGHVRALGWTSSADDHAPRHYYSAALSIARAPYGRVISEHRPSRLSSCRGWECIDLTDPGAPLEIAERMTSRPAGLWPSGAICRDASERYARSPCAKEFDSPPETEELAAWTYRQVNAEGRRPARRGHWSAASRLPCVGASRRAGYAADISDTALDTAAQTAGARRRVKPAQGWLRAIWAEVFP